METGRRSTLTKATKSAKIKPSPRGEKSFDTTRKMMEMPRFGFVWYCFVVAELAVRAQKREKFRSSVCQPREFCMFFFMSKACLRAC